MPFLPGKDHHNFSHGQCTKRFKSGAYKSWLSMISRCNPKNIEERPAYAGSGIEVCKRWLESFTSFYEDMGDRPSGCTIDRIDPQKGYEPDNCRWATNREQALNRRNVIFAEVQGEIMCLHDISKKYGVPNTTIVRRHKQGLRGEDLICKKNRNVLRVGSQAPSSKLSENDVSDIKRLILQGVRNVDLAKMFSISATVISQIRNGKLWPHVAWPEVCKQENNDSFHYSELDRLQAAADFNDDLPV